MRFTDVFVTCALVVLVAVLAAPVVFRLSRRPTPWTPRVRRTLWVGGLCAAVLLLAQALIVDEVADVDGPTAVDREGLEWSLQNRVGWAVFLGRVLALIGGPGAMALLSAIAVGVLVVRHARFGAIVVGATALGATALVNGFKQLYGRSRPPPADQVINYVTHALPSGHALGSLVVVGVLATVLVLRRNASTVQRVLTLSGAFLFVFAVGASRVYLAAHWVTDVLVGWLLGGAWLTFGVTALVLLRRTGAPPDEASTTAAQGERGP